MKPTPMPKKTGTPKKPVMLKKSGMAMGGMTDKPTKMPTKPVPGRPPVSVGLPTPMPVKPTPKPNLSTPTRGVSEPKPKPMGMAYGGMTKTMGMAKGGMTKKTTAKKGKK